MQEQKSSRDRLEAGIEAKRLSNYPRLKRAILRSWFVVILFTVALPLLVGRAFEEDASVEMIVAAAIDAVLVIGVLWFSLWLIKSFRERQWEMLKRLLGFGTKLFLGLAILTGISAVTVLLVSQQILPTLIVALGAVAIIVWRKDYVRAKEELVAMLADREAAGLGEATMPEQDPPTRRRL